MFEQNRRREEKKEQLEEREEAHLAGLAVSVSIASEIQIRTFKQKLDQYEAATVEALMTNQEALDEVRARLHHILGNAHVLEDGRRVFRTEDGAQVFDEHGDEVGPEEISPDEIDPTLPSWEAYKAERDLEHALVEERTQLLDFQAKLDETRTEVDGRDISTERLEELDAELAAMMPPTIATSSNTPEPADHSEPVQTTKLWAPPVAAPTVP
ncbi:MAG: hypothetical protein AAF709_20740 [Pseudomonadota bacterium]